jgi:hypothetical protein
MNEPNQDNSTSVLAEAEVLITETPAKKRGRPRKIKEEVAPVVAVAEPIPEITPEPVPAVPAKPKRVLTQAQLDTLKKGREKGMEKLREKWTTKNQLADEKRALKEANRQLLQERRDKEKEEFQTKLLEKAKTIVERRRAVADKKEAIIEKKAPSTTPARGGACDEPRSSATPPVTKPVPAYAPPPPPPPQRQARQVPKFIFV